jgi:type IX secretion system PorP/SprF family membrane protein
VPYKTFAAYGDLGIMRKIYKRYFVGIGLSIISDEAGDGNLSVTKIMASGAFHYALNTERNNYISVGLQTGWVEKRIDWSKLYFDNQWNELIFDRNLPSGEQGYSSGTGYPDFQIGATYTYGASKNVSAYFSAAIYHAGKPKDSFFDDPNDLGTRPVISTGLTVKANINIKFYPSIYYMSQKAASELMLGSMMSYDLSEHGDETNLFYIGAYIRTGDAWYPVAGYKYHSVRILFNYDINYSELTPASGGQGAWELSIQYIGSFKKSMPKVYNMPCPRF